MLTSAQKRSLHTSLPSGVRLRRILCTLTTHLVIAPPSSFCEDLILVRCFANAPYEITLFIVRSVAIATQMTPYSLFEALAAWTIAQRWPAFNSDDFCRLLLQS